MIKKKVFKMELKTLSPVHIGSGQLIGKKEYLHDARNRKISVMDERKFIEYIVDKKLTQEYEEFILNKNLPLDTFFRKNNLNYNPEIIKYVIDYGNYDYENLREIHTVIRDAFGNPYIPGSSLKGMIRTLIIIYLIEKKHPYLDYNAQKDPQRFYRENSDKIKEIMRNIQVSDTNSIRNHNITIGEKMDLVAHEDYVNPLPTAREFIKDGTMLEFSLSFENDLADHVNEQLIQDVIKNFSTYYLRTYHSYYDRSADFRETVGAYQEPFVILGGGSGYYGKNIVYPLLKDQAVSYVADQILNRGFFKKHKHYKDKQLGISPRTLKLTDTEFGYQQIGLCALKVIENVY